MTGVTCKAGNAHSSRAPDFSFQWRVHAVQLLFTDFANFRTSVYWSTIWFCLLWYELILTLNNVYWDEAPILTLNSGGFWCFAPTLSYMSILHTS